MGWAWFFEVQTDTPTKLAAFAYAVEHLEIAGYELLRRVALRANDPVTNPLCQEIVAQERAMADSLAADFDLTTRTLLDEIPT